MYFRGRRLSIQFSLFNVYAMFCDCCVSLFWEPICLSWNIEAIEHSQKCINCWCKIINHCSDPTDPGLLFDGQYQFLYDHWDQAKLSLVSTCMGNSFSGSIWVLLLTLKVDIEFGPQLCSSGLFQRQVSNQPTWLGQILTEIRILQLAHPVNFWSETLL